MKSAAALGVRKTATSWPTWWINVDQTPDRVTRIEPGTAQQDTFDTDVIAAAGIVWMAYIAIGGATAGVQILFFFEDVHAQRRCAVAVNSATILD